MKELWWSKYRPKTLDEYVFNNDSHRTQIEGWVQQGSIPNLLLHGGGGLGKSALASLLVELLGVHERDILRSNGSKEGRRINWVDDVLEPWCRTMPFGEFKVVIVEEADYMGLHTVQPALRDLMEREIDSTRFILTCNYPTRIMPFIRSRCQTLTFQKMDKVEFTTRIATVLLNENVEFDIGTLDQYVDACYPDMRHCFNEVENASLSGTLLPFTGTTDVSDYYPKMVELFQSGEIAKARELVCQNIEQDGYEDLYRWLYDNLSYLGNTQEKQDEAVKIIKRALVDHTIISDPEINLADCMIRLAHNFAG